MFCTPGLRKDKHTKTKAKIPQRKKPQMIDNIPRTEQYTNVVL